MSSYPSTMNTIQGHFLVSGDFSGCLFSFGCNISFHDWGAGAGPLGWMTRMASRTAVKARESPPFG